MFHHNGQFNHSQINLNASNFASKDIQETTATLYVFSHRNFGQVHHRPILMNIDSQFISQVYDMAHNKNLSNNAMINQIKDPKMAMRLRPHINADYMTDFKTMEAHHTFIFWVDLARGYSPSGIVVPVTTRAILSGFILGADPTMTGTLNPNAKLVVTKRSVTTVTTSHAPGGDQSIVRVENDANVVPGKLLEHLSDTRPRFMRAEDLFGAVIPDEQGTTFMEVGGNDNSVNKYDSLATDAKSTIPYVATKMIVEPVIQATRHLANQSFKSSLDEDYNSFLMSDPIGSFVKDASVDTTSRTKFPHILDSDIMLISDLEQRWPKPYLKIMMVNVPESAENNAIDQKISSSANRWRSMLCDAIPPMIAARGFSSLSFEYDSRSRNITNPEGDILTHHLGTIVPCSDATISMARSIVYKDLKESIFPMLQADGGDFHLVMNASSSGITKCWLNFYDDSQHYKEPFEMPTMFGGMISGITASPKTTSDNAMSLNAYLSFVTNGAMQDSFERAYPPRQLEEKLIQDQINENSGMPESPYLSTPMPIGSRSDFFMPIPMDMADPALKQQEQKSYQVEQVQPMSVRKTLKDLL